MTNSRQFAIPLDLVSWKVKKETFFSKTITRGPIGPGSLTEFLSQGEDVNHKI